MCGIVGITGHPESIELVLDGLSRLEYRGYDSAGIAYSNRAKTSTIKDKGRIDHLRQLVGATMKAKTVIGHTRWATHGIPSKINAHPHTSKNERFALVHNGVIENYEMLKNTILCDVIFESETDTEVIVHLIEHFSTAENTTLQAFHQAIALLEGSYAIVLIDNHSPDHLYVAKQKSPLLIGIGDSFYAASSDVMALLPFTRTYLDIQDGELAVLTPASIQLYTNGLDPLKRSSFESDLELEETEKGAYSHFMLKEIDEQPSVLRRIIQKYQNIGGQLVFEPALLQRISKSDRIYIIACGTSYHAGLVGKDYLEKIAHIPTEVHISSEFVHHTPLLVPNSIFIFISQSGETADSRAALVKIKQQGHPTLTITNTKGSTLAREADYYVLLHAGIEIAVASTKAYTAQLAVLFLLGNAVRHKDDPFKSREALVSLSKTAHAMDTVFDQKEKIKNLTLTMLKQAKTAFFIGRGVDYATCLESALKLKEISYIQAEGYAAGELKHGPIALIEDGTPVFAFITEAHIAANTRSNTKEVEARGAKVAVIATENLTNKGDAFVLPNVEEFMTPFISVLVSQLISYYAALDRGCDIDKPKNLAKSVTVE
jgi:glucosamine--fructose-6-phosphate aminotransferase (isomerizing)